MERVDRGRGRARKRLTHAAMGIALAMVLIARPAAAQDAALDDLRARIERLERENQELRQAQGPVPEAAASPSGPQSIEAIIDQRIKENEAQKKAEEELKKRQAAEQGYVVGSDLSAKPSFKDGLFPWIETPNKDFTLHISCWIQYDNVWWDQSPGLLASRGANAGRTQGIASGATLGGIGDLQDGMFFRRFRPNFEGTFWETGEYRIIPALENDVFSTVGLDEVWVGVKDLPLIGTLRVGHVKNAMGLEGDMTTSSRAMTFMERSAYSEAIEMNQNFVTGLFLSNAYWNQRAEWTLVVFRPDVSSSTGAYFGDGQMGVQGRITGLPMYENEGRELLHLGLSGGWRNGSTAFTTVPAVQLRARPELRDDIPPGGFPDADNNRLIDTGIIASDAQYLMGLEALYIRGPFSFQAEYGWNWVSNAVGILNSGTTFDPALAPPQDYVFNGGYVQLAYTLTGENRAYDKRFGTLAREYYGKRGPFSNAWLVRDENGNLALSSGAWEIACRYSYVNLNNGTGENRIQGGILNGVSVGLNWYLNNNLNIMLDWVYDRRDDLPAGSNPGDTSGVGVEVQFQF